jgi:hypothetical protein
MAFPVPHEGFDESEGVVLYEAEVPVANMKAAGTLQWVGVRVEHADGRGWVVGGFSNAEEVTNDTGMLRKRVPGPCYIIHGDIYLLC